MAWFLLKQSHHLAVVKNKQGMYLWWALLSACTAGENVATGEPEMGLKVLGVEDARILLFVPA